MDIYSKPADSKPYVPFIWNHPRHCLTTTPFSLGRRIYTIVENRNVKEKRFQDREKNITRTKANPKLLIKASILKAKEIPLEVFKATKTIKNKEIIPFTITSNPNNPNVSPIIKESFDSI